jgi:hypothetical protein
MGGVSVRGESQPRVRIEVLEVQTLVWCKRWMRIGAWGRGEVLDQITHDGGRKKIHAQASDGQAATQARRGDKGAAASRPGIGENATLRTVNGYAWNIIMGYICTTLHRVTCN